MVRCYRAANLLEAHLLRGMLANAGIESAVLNAHATGAAGELPPGETAPEIWLARDQDLGRARQLLLAYEDGRADGGARRCRHCGETNPAAFELCWRCGLELDNS